MGLIKKNVKSFKIKIFLAWHNIGIIEKYQMVLRLDMSEMPEYLMDVIII